MIKIVQDQKNKGGNRGYSNAGDRRRAIRGLAKQGFNYFVGYRDVAADYALNYGRADWVDQGRIYVKDA